MSCSLGRRRLELGIFSRIPWALPTRRFHFATSGFVNRSTRCSYSSGTSFKYGPLLLRGGTHSQSRFRWMSISPGCTAVAFMQFDEPDSKGDGETREERMINVSRMDIAQQQAQEYRGFGNAVRRWLIEPVLTTTRLLYLMALFIPLISLMSCLLFPSQQLSGLWFRYVRWTLEQAGPSFIKLGQWAASRADIFPGGLCDELGRLHSNAKEHSIAYTRRTISAAFGRPFDECFVEFDDKPLGVGAMGQVYRAKVVPGVLSDDSIEEVAVKVLHPHIENMVSRDLSIMAVLAEMVNVLPTMEWLSLPGEVSTFASMMQAQLDLRIEAENLRIFAHNYKGWSNVAFPKCYPEVTTRKVLVEELVEGLSMEKILHFSNQGPLDRKIASLGLDAFLKMLLLHNFIHSDLHAGNIMVRFPAPHDRQLVKNLQKANTMDEWQSTWSKLQDSGSEPHICFIDAGLVTELSPRNRNNFVDLFKAIATFDGYKAGELMVERSRTPETAIDPDVFALRSQKLVDQVKRRTFALGSIRLGDLLTNMMEMVRHHHVRMESDFITVVLSILLLEGIGRRLNPDLDIFKASIPILRQVGVQQAAHLGVKGFEADDLVQMFKVWLVLEARELIGASVQDIYNCVKYDRLSPNE